MLRSFLLLCLSTIVLNFSSSAQLGKIPVAVTAAFAKQYTSAKEVSYEDNLSDYAVKFVVDSSKMLARYSSKGIWKGSEKTISFDSLSADVKDGFKKSKFADWKVQSVLQMYLAESAGGGVQYRIKVTKTDLKKRYLYFNRLGRLVRDTMTL